MRRILLFLIILLMNVLVKAQDTLKSYTTIRATSAIKIDGHLDEDLWKQAPVMDSFFQFLPNEGSIPDHPNEVRIVYDNDAIYIGAIMFDSHPDSILRELGARDAEDINADYLRIGIDPYNNRQDAYFLECLHQGCNSITKHLILLTMQWRAKLRLQKKDGFWR
ncbi:MAG: hypothetical protein IPP71_04305 [Bacteroidetes bacterium]|nr:hypothetical protein [Bacteroidota bacterium]